MKKMFLLLIGIAIVLCGCSKSVSHDAIEMKDNVFLISSADLCARFEDNNDIKPLIKDTIVFDKFIQLICDNDTSISIRGDESKIHSISIDAIKSNQSSGQSTFDLYKGIFYELYPDVVLDDFMEVSNRVFDTGLSVPAYYKDVRVHLNIRMDSKHATITIDALGDKKPEHELVNSLTPIQLVRLNVKESNTFDSVNYITQKAKQDAELATIESVDFALNYLINNVNDFYSSNSMMEKVIYYGTYLENTCRARNLTFADFGYDALNAVKDVYTNIETREDSFSYENYTQVLEWIDFIQSCIN